VKRYTPSNEDVLRGLAFLFLGGLVGCFGIGLVRLILGGV
jgi:hypothetical protein